MGVSFSVFLQQAKTESWMPNQVNFGPYATAYWYKGREYMSKSFKKDKILPKCIYSHTVIHDNSSLTSYFSSLHSDIK